MCSIQFYSYKVLEQTRPIYAESRIGVASRTGEQVLLGDGDEGTFSGDSNVFYISIGV